MTACLIGLPRKPSAVSFSLPTTKAPIWAGEYFWPRASSHASPFECLTILNGTLCRSFWTSASVNLRPIRRLVAKKVFCGQRCQYSKSRGDGRGSRDYPGARKKMVLDAPQS
mgnify:CR=1 FL=1|jgi:hypothetical protein